MNQQSITVTAHKSHWYDVLTAIFSGINAAQPFIAQFIPAPIEAGIQIATQVVPIVVAEATGNGTVGQ